MDGRARHSAGRAREPRPRGDGPAWRVPARNEEPDGDDHVRARRAPRAAVRRPRRGVSLREPCAAPPGQAKELSARLRAETGHGAWVTAVAVVWGHFVDGHVEHENVV